MQMHLVSNKQLTFPVEYSLYLKLAVESASVLTAIGNKFALKRHTHVTLEDIKTH